MPPEKTIGTDGRSSCPRPSGQQTSRNAEQPNRGDWHQRANKAIPEGKRMKKEEWEEGASTAKPPQGSSRKKKLGKEECNIFAGNRRAAGSVMGFLSAAAGWSCRLRPPLSEFTEQLLRAGTAAICCQLRSPLLPSPHSAQSPSRGAGAEHPAHVRPAELPAGSIGEAQRGSPGQRAARMAPYLSHAGVHKRKRWCPLAAIHPGCCYSQKKRESLHCPPSFGKRRLGAAQSTQEVS